MVADPGDQRQLVVRAEAWRDASQGLELALRTKRKTRRLRVSLNAQVLISTLVLYSMITSAQFVGAWYANSLSLLIDCSSMLVDVISYVAAIWAECSPREKQRNEMIASALSMLALWGVTLPAIVGALAVLAESERRLQLKAQGVTVFAGDDENDQPNPYVILGFAIAGIVCDSISLTCFCRQQRRRAQKREPDPRRRPAAVQLQRFTSRSEARNGTASRVMSDEHGTALIAAAHLSDEEEQPSDHQHSRRARQAKCTEAGAAADPEDDDGAAEDKGDAVNMRSALAHVVADSCRSVSTAIAALLIIHLDFDPRTTDAKCSLVVAAFVISASVGVCKLWCTLACRDMRTTFRRAPPGAHGERRPAVALASASAQHGVELPPAAEPSVPGAGRESEWTEGESHRPAPNLVWQPLPLQPAGRLHRTRSASSGDEPQFSQRS